MPVGPKGEKRPADVVAKIAVGEAEEQYAGDKPKRVRRKVVKRTRRLKGRGLPEDTAPDWEAE